MVNLGLGPFFSGSFKNSGNIEQKCFGWKFNWIRFHLQSVFRKLGLSLKGPLKRKIVILNKTSQKNKFDFIIMKFVTNYAKSVLESYESPLVGYPQKQCLRSW